MVTEPLAAADSDLRYTIATAGPVQGELALRLPELSAIHLARKFLGEPDTRLHPKERLRSQMKTAKLWKNFSAKLQGWPQLPWLHRSG